ncbi:tripartite tricarboxylate transporter permease [Fluviibacterium sp. DFM31]|uniref:Tripartite tricarboxylate transporter permease n=1 Tax=Meridianimarinicoccus marinus TaxID=3231483 RepID=A0ABV3L1F1_9RHOB
MVPTLALEIPGSPTAVAILPGPMVHVLPPAPTMLTEQADFAFAIFWSMMLVNVIFFFIGLIQDAMLETRQGQSVLMLDENWLLIVTRPVSLFFLVLVALTLFGPMVWRHLSKQCSPLESTGEQQGSGYTPSASMSGPGGAPPLRPPVISAPVPAMACGKRAMRCRPSGSTSG